ncbi:hypothetical protein NQZ68_022618 [Dissostichus eleginoides]|nr:hypothetical protein NQZ68_022618 [Dissostichus eleginoides]
MPGDLPGVDSNEDKESGGFIIAVDPRDGSHWADARASWMTVSMWQSSLKWKGSRRQGFCASFAKLGFHPFHSVCQWLGL